MDTAPTDRRQRRPAAARRRRAVIFDVWKESAVVSNAAQSALPRCRHLLRRLLVGHAGRQLGVPRPAALLAVRSVSRVLPRQAVSYVDRVFECCFGYNGYKCSIRIAGKCLMLLPSVTS